MLKICSNVCGTMLNTKYQDLVYKVLALERANSSFLQANHSLEFFLK